jgi:hypothetical protein
MLPARKTSESLISMLEIRREERIAEGMKESHFTRISFFIDPFKIIKGSALGK